MGTANEILANMSKRDETRMIDGIVKHNFEGFWEINQPLNDKTMSDLKKYAVRIFSNCHHTYVQPNLPIDLHEEQPITVGEMLCNNFPRIFEQSLGDSGDIEITRAHPCEVIVQGVLVDLNTPLYWLQINMSYLDNFLYISLHFN